MNPHAAPAALGWRPRRLPAAELREPAAERAVVRRLRVPVRERARRVVLSRLAAERLQPARVHAT